MDKPRRKSFSLRWGLSILVILCWIVPVGATIAVAGALLNNTFTSSMQDNISSATENAVNTAEQRLAAAMTASREVTYDGTVYDALGRYRENGDGVSLYQEITVYLSRKYDTNTSFQAVFLHIPQGPQEFYYTHRGMSTRAGLISRYQHSVMDTLLDQAEQMSTEIRFFLVDGELYMVRNLVDATFQPYGVLIMLCDTDTLFSSIYDLSGLVNAEITLDQAQLTWTAAQEDHRPTLTAEHQVSSTGVNLQVSTVTAYTDLLGAMPALRPALALVGLMLLPILALVIWFFYRYVSQPVDVLVDASSRVAQGQRGYCIDTLPQSQELRTLTEHFNTMSVELKRQFDRSYQEQQALQEARIKALRSQINPHFLNNTLEIINWEARLAGDSKVSQMIEALSTMLGAALARDGRDLIALGEELSYVDAYLYIIRQRLGDRLTVVEDIPQELRDAIVPRLILQPLVENAVDHGVSCQAKGALELHVRREGSLLAIEVAHDGQLSPEDQAKIARLLSDEAAPELVSKVGIRNVNQRLRLLYGREYGLTLAQVRPNWILARVTLPFSVLPDAGAV